MPRIPYILRGLIDVRPPGLFDNEDRELFCRPKRFIHARTRQTLPYVQSRAFYSLCVFSCSAAVVVAGSDASNESGTVHHMSSDPSMRVDAFDSSCTLYHTIVKTGSRFRSCFRCGLNPGADRWSSGLRGGHARSTARSCVFSSVRRVRSDPKRSKPSRRKSHQSHAASVLGSQSSPEAISDWLAAC